MRLLLTRCGFACLLVLGVLGGAGCRDIIDNFGDDDGQVCDTSAECPMGEVCAGGHCGAPGRGGIGDFCWASRDCMDGLYCAPTLACAPAGTGDVGDACAHDGECMSGLRCDLKGFSGNCGEAGAGEPGASCAGNGDCLAGLYCAPADMTCKNLVEAFPPFLGVECAAPEGPFRPYFEVPRPGAPPADFYRLPFPNDIRVDASGALDMSDFPRPGPTPLGIDLVQLYVDALVDDFEGFGATAVVTFRFAGPLNFDTTSGDTIQFVDITPGSTGGLGLGWSWSTGRTKYSCENRLSVRANVQSPLKPGHTYAVILTTGIKSQDNTQNAEQDDDFAAVISPTRPSGDPALERAWDVYQPLRDYLNANGMASGNVAAAAVFTVQDTTGHMERLVAHAETQPLPVLEDLTLCDTGVQSPCDDGGGERACPAANPEYHLIHGRFTVPIYQAGTPPYLTPGDGGGIVEEAGAPVVQRTEEVCFAMSVPKGATMPVGGWPLMVYHHGTGGSMHSFVSDGVASEMATGAVPGAVFSFDGVNHGARRGQSSEHPNNLVFNALNPRAARDNLLQGGVDILQALRVAEVTVGAPGSPTGEAIAFDPALVTFFGHSQGSSSGELAIAFTGRAPAVIFSGAGSFLTSSLLEKTQPVNVAAGMTFLLGDEFNAEHPVMNIFQTYFERSDAINYTPLIVRSPPAGVPSKHVWMSYGTMDTFTPKGTLTHNARGLGTPVVAPELEALNAGSTMRPVGLNKLGGDGQSRFAACFQYAPQGYDGHFVAVRDPQAIADWTAFIFSWLETGTPTVP